jgi:hypothetical protein
MRRRLDHVCGNGKLFKSSNLDAAGKLPLEPHLLPTNSIVEERKLHFFNLIVTLRFCRTCKTIGKYLSRVSTLSEYNVTLSVMTVEPQSSPDLGLSMSDPF